MQCCNKQACKSARFTKILIVLPHCRGVPCKWMMTPGDFCCTHWLSDKITCGSVKWAPRQLRPASRKCTSPKFCNTSEAVCRHEGPAVPQCCHTTTAEACLLMGVSRKDLESVMTGYGRALCYKHACKQGQTRVHLDGNKSCIARSCTMFVGNHHA